MVLEPFSSLRCEDHQSEEAFSETLIRDDYAVVRSSGKPSPSRIDL